MFLAISKFMLKAPNKRCLFFWTGGITWAIYLVIGLSPQKDDSLRVCYYMKLLATLC